MTTTYRAGAIGRTGGGNFGHGLDVAYEGIPNVKFIAVADPDPNGRQAAVERAGAEQSYADYKEMLEKANLDLVSVCPRWIDCHSEMVIACAEAGVKGIFCEKPFAQTLVEADAMIDACERNGVKMAVAHRRASGYEQHAKKLVDAGEIGEIRMTRGHGKDDRRAGAMDLMVLGTHILDSMRFFAGSDVAWAYGHVTQDGKEISLEDVYEGDEQVGLLAGNGASGYYVFKNGIRASYESHAGIPPGGIDSARWFGFEVYGSEGIIALRNSPKGEMYIYPYGTWIPDEENGKWERVLLEEWENAPEGDTERSNRMIVEELIQAIEDDGEVRNCSSGHDARAALEMIMAVHESQRLGTRVSFPLENRENPYEVWRRETQ